MEVKYFSRVTGKVETEKVYGADAVRWLYENPLAKVLSPLICRAPLSMAYGEIQNSSWSKRKVAPFIKDFEIPIGDFLPENGEYNNFNDFFIRRFRNGKRSFVENRNEMGAFAEARYFGYESMTPDKKIPVKGNFLSSEALLENTKWASSFKDGPLLLARLCPVDYHRFHFPDGGKVIEDYRIHGLFHSVNPLALKVKPEIFIENERHVTILDTDNFGKMAYIEVGAICVGKIIQSKPLYAGMPFSKGDEKGYFLFGGSTVIVLGEKGKWTPSSDIVNNTHNGLETYLQLGMTAAILK
jgi:phosphatidylserine decarboxylase